MGLLRAVGRTAVVAGTATAVSNRVSRRQANRWQQQSDAQAYNDQQQYAPPPQQQYAQPAPQPVYAAPPPPAAAPDDELVTQLKRLADLHTQGILTDEEF